MAANGAHHLHARALAEAALHVHNLVALAHAQVDGLLGGEVQAAHGQQCGLTHINAGFDEVAQLKQAHA